MALFDFDIAVYAANEAATIEACVASIDRACAERRAHISVLLNGTTDSSIALLNSMRLEHASISVYLFPVTDKANAINHFLYRLRQDAEAHFGIDAYTQIAPGALRAIAEALAAQPQAYIASGLPLTGRSAQAMAEQSLHGGAVEGRLYALRPSFVDKLVEAGLRLPLQIYRGDPLLGSMAAHDLDPIGTPWDSRRIIGAPNATFAITPLSIFRWRDIRRQYRREIRQARGVMENEAIKSIIYSAGYAALPENANDMIATWLKTNHPQPRSLRERFFINRALRQLNAPRISPAAPELVFSR